MVSVLRHHHAAYAKSIQTACHWKEVRQSDSRTRGWQKACNTAAIDLF